MAEKHEKEIELYRIQLGNATKLITQLEQNITSYKEKRYISFCYQRFYRI